MSMRSRRSLVLALALIAAGWAPMFGASAASDTPPLCKLAPTAVQQVLGVSDPHHYAGPELMVGGTCAWKTTDPNCFLRVLAIRRYVTSAELGVIKNLRAHTKPFDHAPKELGTNSFFAHIDLGPGAAIAIERVYIPRNDGSWVEVTLSGRLGPDGSRVLLIAAAQAVPELVV